MLFLTLKNVFTWQYFRVAREGRELRGQYEPLVEERDIELRNLISQNKDMAHQIAQCTAGVSKKIFNLFFLGSV